MQFKDIVNRDLYNLKNCDEEPIHIPGSIQPHGFLLAIERAGNTIRFCSGNIEEYIGTSYGQVLGRNIADVFAPAFVDEILTKRDKHRRNIVHQYIEGKEFFVTIHGSNGHIIIEGEAVDEDMENENDLYTSSKQLLGYVEDSYTLQQLCQVVAGEVKNITGYDRVMIYRFDEQYNGEVIAESKEEYLEPFLGLHYPHTDIPVQARELYIKNQLRIIGNVNYTPVPIYTTGEGSNKSLDMSLSVLRSVSPIHLQYLQNMGVGATLTISLLHKGKLWGLIACHHYSPKYISSGVRQAAKLQGHFITSQIDIRLLNEEYEMAEKANKACDDIVSMRNENNAISVRHIIQQEKILQLCNAAGVSVIAGADMYTYGHTPQATDIKKLAVYLAEYTNSTELHTDLLASVSPELSAIAGNLPGISYYPLGFDTSDCIIWYREESVAEVNWAGDPAKAIEKDSNGLSPRKSFMLWKEIVKGKSKPWQQYELNACRRFFNFLQNHLRSAALFSEHEKQKEVTRMLKETNAELENINWISTHDLQEPLRKIRIISSMILSDELDYSPEYFYDLVSKMNKSAERMQVLIQDILSYTRVKSEDTFEPVNIDNLLQEVIAEMEEPIQAKDARIVTGTLPVVNGIPFLLAQLFSNLLNNSLKFCDPGRKPEITITGVTAGGEGMHKLPGTSVVIRYADNGIGFGDEHNEKIFNVFSRLHTKDEYPGSGIGLALCKKIMNRHNGTITAEGMPGKGAIFYIQFPV